VARGLLGQRLVKVEANGRRTSGRIVETEAYVGSRDLGCHAHAGRTRRNETMWGPAGRAYVYFTYGMHWMLNLVTEADGFPAAVLLRALVVEEGLDRARRRRGGRAALSDGPAKLCQVLAVDGRWDGHDLCRPHARMFVERVAGTARPRVRVGPRIGLDGVPEPWRGKPWRFRLAGAFPR
jgi:DNA-3-methyladenine glycosylase